MKRVNDVRLEEALRATSVSVLEDLCFVCPDPADDPSPSRTSALTVEVTFRGPAKGALALRFLDLPREEIARAMLGEEDSALSEEETRDALGEVANVICGQLLPRVAGDEVVFDLGPPSYSDVAAPGEPEAFVAFAALGGRIEVALRVTSGALSLGTT